MTVDDLLAERDIYRALVAIARAMDQRDWAAIERMAADDMSSDLGLGEQVGREAFITCMRSFLDACGPTQHLLGNVLIEVDGEWATSKAYVSDMHVGAGEKSESTFRTLGDYHDRWKRVEGRWQLVHRTKINHAHIGSFAVLGPGPN